jgi:hypothetical protein
MVSEPIFATVSAVVLIVDRRRIFADSETAIVRPTREVMPWTGG